MEENIHHIKHTDAEALENNINYFINEEKIKGNGWRLVSVYRGTTYHFAWLELFATGVK